MMNSLITHTRNWERKVSNLWICTKRLQVALSFLITRGLTTLIQHSPLTSEFSQTRYVMVKNECTVLLCVFCLPFIQSV